MKNKHLVYISVDAMVFEDLEYLKNLPAFSRLLDGASIIERVTTVYPSVTHPVHASLITGAPTGVTGIVNNLIFDKNAGDLGGGVWFNSLSDIKCDTLLHAAKRAGLTTASSTWPLTSHGEKDIDYLVPNIMNSDFIGYEDDILSAYRKLGAKDNVIDIIEKGTKLYGHKNMHPEFDNFQVYCASEIIRKYKPDLILVHPGDVDSARHQSGLFTEPVRVALENTDRWLGMIYSAIDEAGISDNTDIVLVSDHGQIGITRTVSPNVWMVDKGYIRLDENGSLKDWDVYVQCTGASAHVYLSRPDDKALYDEVYSLLENMASEGIYGFEKVYTEKETREKYGLFGDFSFVLETDGYTSFGERLTRPVVCGFDLGDYRLSRATHGHDPKKGPQPPFIANGPSFKKGIVIPYGNLLDHAPTVAAALGIDLLDSKGKPVYEILE